MRKGEQTRQHMVKTASRLFATQGYAATGLKQILEESGTPRGSLYFHFAGGKDALAEAVIESYTATFQNLIDTAAAQADTTAAAAQHLLGQLATLLEAHPENAGCPVVAIAQETAARSDTLRAAARGALEQWSATLVDGLRAEGHTPGAAASRARAFLCAVEGALLLTPTFADTRLFTDLIALAPVLLGPAPTPAAPA